jgi:hypothetical protein
MLLKKSKLEGNELAQAFRYTMLARGIWAVYSYPVLEKEAKQEWVVVNSNEEFELHLDVLEGKDEFDVLQFTFIGSYKYLVLVRGSGDFIPKFYLMKNGKQFGIQSEPSKDFLGRLPAWTLFKSYLQKQWE